MLSSFAIAEITLRKLKEPAFFLMFVFCIIVGIFSSGMGALSDELSGSLMSQFINTGKGDPILTSTIFILLISVLISVFIGATDIPRDIDSHTILMLLSKPISKHQYLMGKFLGVFGLCAVFFVAAQISIFVTYYLNHGAFYPAGVMVRQLLLILLLFPVVSLALMISCFAGDFSSMVITSVYLLFSISVCVVPLLVEMLPKSIGVSFYLLVVYYFFPNFVYYFQSCQAFSFSSICLIVYSLSLSTVFMCVAHYRISTRDLV